MDAPTPTSSAGIPTDANVEHAYETLAAIAGRSPVPTHGPIGFGNYPAVSREWLKRMISILDVRGQLTHAAWGKALGELQKLVLLPEEPSAFIPLDILSTAKKACTQDFEHLGDFIHQADENQMLLLNKQRPVSGWAAQCMARIVGFDADQEDDSKWWLTSDASEWVEDLHEEAYIRIHYAHHRFIQAQALYCTPNDFQKALEFALKGFGHMKAFVHLHQNGQVLARVENHLKELQGLIRAKGLGGHLLPFY